ncbi:MAG: 50S ribosomal protein L25P [Ignavibacteria bacterium]|nr:MAG: 50S ribosomal protein L25P [Ignavibacteria bacterium]KAF0160420.1 MAG: 50S ribosomal protein L25P [Ignavibacteria bacterium]
MSEISVKAEKRTKSTKGVVNEARRNGTVPGIYYSKGAEPISLFITEGSLKPLVYTSETHLVNLQIEDQELKSILKNIQFDPVTDRIIHCDFLGITADQEIEIDVPVALEGQAKGVKEGGVVSHSLHKIKVLCLPAYIPEHIVINISDLALGKAFYIKDLKLENVQILHPEEAIIVSVNLPRAAQEASSALPGEEMKEPEVISKGKQAEEEE